jgi:hypothetical protein
MANDLPTSGLLLHPAGASSLGIVKQGNLRTNKIEEEVGVPGAIPGGF